MSFLMASIYPYWVWVTRGMESSMTKAENEVAAGSSNPKACGCSTGAALHPQTAKAECCGDHDHSDHGHHHHQTDANATVLDPVCGMSVNPATSQHRFDYLGETFHFCSAGCRTKFAADPKTYLDKSKPNPDV